MKDSLVKNYLYDISYRVVIMLLPLILTPYISRVIGPEGLGIYGFTSSIITLFCVLSELGSATYAVNCVAKSRVDRQELLRVYKELRLFRVLAVVVCYILLILFIVFYSRYSMIFWINSIILIADAFDVSWYLEGIESFKILSTRNIFIRLCSAIAIFVFVKGKDDLALYVTILSSASLIGNICVLFQIKNNESRITGCNILRHLKPMLFFSLPQFAVYINANLDKSILGFLGNNDAIAFYSQPERIVQIVQSILTSLGFVLFPRISKLIADSKLENAKELIYLAATIVVIAGIPMVLGLIVVADIFIPIFLGKGYEQSIIILKLYSPIVFIQGLRAVVCTPLFIPLGRGKNYNISIVLCAFFNIILDIIFIPNYGVNGAVFATVFSELFALILQLWYLRDIINLNKLWSIILRYHKAYIGMVAVIFFVGHWLIKSWIGRFVGVVVAGIVSYTVLMIVYYRNDLIFLFNTFRINQRERQKCGESQGKPKRR